MSTATVFTFNRPLNQWENSDSPVTLRTGHCSTVPHIPSTDDNDRFAIGTFLCHVTVGKNTVPLTVSVCHNVLMSGAGDSAGALLSDDELTAFIAASGLARDVAEDIAEQIAYGLNEGWCVTGGDTCVYDSKADDEITYPWSLHSLTFTRDFAATLAA